MPLGFVALKGEMIMLVSSSLIKKLMYRGEPRRVCPQQVYRCYILKDVDTVQTDSMLYGSYFETLCLGSGARGRKTNELPRLELTKKQEQANRIAIAKGQPQIYYGDKSTAQVKIEAQAAEFRRLCAKYQVVVASPYNTQVLVYKQFDEDIMAVGEMDIFPTPVMTKRGLKVAILDLKLTGDINSDWGEYCYGKPEELDDTQGLMYHYLARDIDFDLNDEMNPDNNLRDLFTEAVRNIIKDGELEFALWVFDYKKTMEKLGNKFVPMPYTSPGYKFTSLHEGEIKERIRTTVNMCRDFEETGWREMPGVYCKDCPMKETCITYAESKKSF